MTAAPELDRAGADVTRTRARASLAAILAVAFALRVVYVLQSRASPFFAEPQMDALYHTEWARAFAAGRDFQPGPFFRAPLYPWFLGLCFKLSGGSFLAPRLVQAAIGTLGVALTYLVGARAFDRRVGLLAALFAAGYWVLIYFDGELLLPVLEVPLDLAAIWLSLRVGRATAPAAATLAPREPRPLDAALAGLAWGVSAIVRPNVLLFAPIVAAWIAWLAWRASREMRTRVLAPGAFVLGLLVPILPITAYNAFVGGDAVLISSQGGVNLWIGNNPQSDGSSAIVPGTRADWWGGYYDAIHQAEAAEGRRLKPSEVSRWYTRKAIDFVLANPLTAARQLAWKLRLFWTDFELGNNVDERFFAYRYGAVLRVLPLGFALVAPLSLIGLALCARRAWRDLPLWGFVPVYMASVVAFFVCSRFRVPVLPVLTVFAAYACVWSADALRAGRRVPLAIALLAFALLALGVTRIPAAIDRTDSNGLWLLGVNAEQHGDLDDAIELYREAIAARPRNAYAHAGLGSALAAKGDLDAAEQSLRQAIAIRPDNPATWTRLFEVELAAQRFDDAQATVERLFALAPYSAAAQRDRGRLAYARASAGARAGASGSSVRELLEQALAAFRAGLALHPDPNEAFDCAYGAGTALLDFDRPHEAADAFRAALDARTETDPEGWFWSCAELCTQALKRDGRAGEVRALAEELLRRFPNDPRSREFWRRHAHD
jgi:tetratricopeptide (TPR) repeat protein